MEFKKSWSHKSENKNISTIWNGEPISQFPWWNGLFIFRSSPCVSCADGSGLSSIIPRDRRLEPGQVPLPWEQGTTANFKLLPWRLRLDIRTKMFMAQVPHCQLDSRSQRSSPNTTIPWFHHQRTWIHASPRNALEFPRAALTIWLFGAQSRSSLPALWSRGNLPGFSRLSLKVRRVSCSEDNQLQLNLLSAAALQYCVWLFHLSRLQHWWEIMWLSWLHIS